VTRGVNTELTVNTFSAKRRLWCEVGSRCAARVERRVRRSQPRGSRGKLPFRGDRDRKTRLSFVAGSELGHESRPARLGDPRGSERHPDRAVTALWSCEGPRVRDVTSLVGPSAGRSGTDSAWRSARSWVVPAGTPSGQTPGQPSPRLRRTGSSVATGGRLCTVCPLKTRKPCWRGARAAESESLLMT
jgi:hypothetical protein